MLGCLTDKGELVRLFWPNIDYPQHIEQMLYGIFTTGCSCSTTWLSDGIWQHSQYYMKDTNVLVTEHLNHDKGLKVVQTDFCHPDRDVLFRHYDIQNIGNHETALGFVAYSSCITTTPDVRSTLFDFGCEALIHYRHGYYVSISATRAAHQFQLGNNAVEAARSGELKGYDSIGMMPDGAVSWDLGLFKAGEIKQFTVAICAGHTLKEVKQLIHWVDASDPRQHLENTRKYWIDFLNNAVSVNTGNVEIDELYKRSLLVFRLMSDESTGGLLAAPEIDEGFTRCGRYAYCWGRDAAFITGALDKCGLTDAVDRFYDWSVQVQDEDGSWQQRYHMDGNLAPSWGLQIDETGTLIWGMYEHYKVTGNRNFLDRMWDSVQRGVEYMLGFIDEETGLPKPSYDLWEERIGEHAYSSAAVYGGIRAGSSIAGILGKQEEVIERWDAAAKNLRESIGKNLWKEEYGRFLRSIRVKLNPWGREHSSNTLVIPVNSKGYRRDVTLEDGMIDVSLLGVSIPFEVFDFNDPRVENTVNAIEQALTSHGTGGIKRYESDNYIGGNPWILTTLWVALYHIRRKNFDAAKKYFEWAVRGRTSLDLLPEQVGKDDGRPAWIIPLTWSHAMFVLVLFELVEAEAF